MSHTHSHTLFERLSAALPGVPLLAEEPLAKHTSFRIGGPAEVLACPRSEGELIALLAVCRAEGILPRILGGGTNILAPDDGLPGVVIGTRGLDFLALTGENEITAGAGVPLARLAVFAQQKGLTGLEFAHGIPGTVGGGLYMNAGAYGGELSQAAVSARFLNETGELLTLTGEEMALSYRHSAFMGMQGLIVSGTFRLNPGDPAAIQARMRELMEKRSASQPLDLPSAGSTFKRPVGGYAAALIQEAGLKGFRVGDAAVSEKHSGFVVNLGHATGADVLALIAQVQKRVRENSGIELEPEVRIWTSDK
ncbi:MAG: UDP-N-acetylmuramate dehydrogenase [Oscillospiraceae bacterium]|nr:UDP-N-acetylmuramate dehydrogenase [Oscillospiraceae bacterium]